MQHRTMQEQYHFDYLQLSSLYHPLFEGWLHLIKMHNIFNDLSKN